MKPSTAWSCTVLVGLTVLVGEARAADYRTLRSQPDQLPAPATGWEYYGSTEHNSDVAPFCDPNVFGPCNHWLIGAEATLLFADFDDTGTQPDAISSSLTEFGNLYGGPRLWAGYQLGCWAIMGRYWELSGSENFFDSAFQGNNGSTFTDQRLDMFAADLEIAHQYYSCDGLDMQVAFGARHAHLERDSILWSSGTENNDLLTGFAGAFQEFEGHGITGAWSGTTPISFFSDHFNFFWNLRGSVLWGDTRNVGETFASVDGPLGSNADISGQTTISDDELFIGETQLGVQWNYYLRSRPAVAFVRVAGEYQHWSVDAPITGVSSTAGNVGNSEIITVAGLSDLKVNLIGLSVGAGITW